MGLEPMTGEVSAVSTSDSEGATLTSHQETALDLVGHGSHSRAEA